MSKNLKLGSVAVLSWVLLLAVVACGRGKIPENANSVKLPTAVGVWSSGTPVAESNGVRISVKVKIEPNQVTHIAICEFPDGKSVTSQASAPAVITNTSIIISADASHRAGDDDEPCTAAVNAGQINYAVAGNQLTFSDPNQPDAEPIRLTRQ